MAQGLHGDFSLPQPARLHIRAARHRTARTPCRPLLPWLPAPRTGTAPWRAPACAACAWTYCCWWCHSWGSCPSRATCAPRRRPRRWTSAWARSPGGHCSARCAQDWGRLARVGLAAAGAGRWRACVVLHVLLAFLLCCIAGHHCWRALTLPASRAGGQTLGRCQVSWHLACCLLSPCPTPHLPPSTYRPPVRQLCALPLTCRFSEEAAAARLATPSSRLKARYHLRFTHFLPRPPVPVPLPAGAWGGWTRSWGPICRPTSAPTPLARSRPPPRALWCGCCRRSARSTTTACRACAACWPRCRCALGGCQRL